MNHSLLKPPKLNKGDTIGIVAPCLPVLPEFKEQFDLGINELKEMGFKVKFGKTLSLQHWWSGGTPQQQADDIHAMFKDNEVKAIMAAAGGHTAISVLELLDYSMITKHPKPFIGMSDMTGYHLALYSKANLVGFHMDEVSFGLGMNWQKAEPRAKKQARDSFTQVLTEPDSSASIPAIKERKVWREGKAEGRLIGGNLHSITRLIGTPYFPPLDRFDNAILFWEAVGLTRYQIYQMLFQLKYHGIFDRISGMLIGTVTALQPSREENLIEPTVKELTLDIIKNYSFPVMAGMDFGHFTVNMPMPIGLKASFNMTSKDFGLDEGAVE